MHHWLVLAQKSVADTVRRESLRRAPLPQQPGGDEEHLGATIDWLVRACEHGAGGVSSHYSLLHGRWLPPFPETTGYIVPTLFDYGAHRGSAFHRDLAVRLTEWLGEVQLDNGACMQGTYDRRRPKTRPIIFNTGQNIFGFLRAYEETGRSRYLDCARRAGEFLTRSVDERGVWNRHLHHDIPHTYNSRTCWALLELHRVTREAVFEQIAHANLRWVVDQQLENGWFRHANFKPGELPNTHGIAYTLAGLLESYVLCGCERYLTAARRTSDRLLDIFERRRWLYVFWDADWRNHGKYITWMRGRHVCVTGIIQMALVWLRLLQLTGLRAYALAAFQTIDFVKTLQDIGTPHDGVRGGIPGAFPIYGSYSSLKFPNWAAKFWADALLLRQRVAAGRDAPAAATLARA